MKCLVFGGKFTGKGKPYSADWWELEWYEIVEGEELENFMEKKGFKLSYDYYYEKLDKKEWLRIIEYDEELHEMIKEKYDNSIEKFIKAHL